MISKIYLITICTLLAMLVACDKEGAAGNISNNVLITVLDQDGNDLLDPNHPSAVNLNQVKVYYELNGIKTEINRSNLDYPQMYLVQEPNSNSDYYTILLFLNTEDDSNPTTTYFEWSSDNTDVYKSALNRSRGSIQDEKIWLNGELVCDTDVKPGRCELTIIME